MPNSLAYLMLLIWPVVVIVLFTRLRPHRAVIWSILGGYLLLPPVAQINIPMIPAFDKLSIPALSTFLVATLVQGHKVPFLPRSALGRGLILLFLIAPFGTALTNTEPFVFTQIPSSWIQPPGTPPPLPGLTIYDGLSSSIGQIFVLMTFALARRFLGTPEGMRDVLIALMVGGLAYSLPILVEVRLSPQINTWVYGFFQHDFAQMIRFGGFRPIVFLEHGLWVALFMMMTLLATIALARETTGPSRQKVVFAALYLAVILILCKSVGVLVYAALCAPLVALAAPKQLARVAVVLAGFVVLYPVLRAMGFVPVEGMVEFFRALDPERAASLKFRFDNEALLLAHAQEQPLFGWGKWLRNLVHDPLTGQVITISDGRWIIVLGISGWAGYLAEFGLLVLGVARLPRRAVIDPAAGALALLLGINMIDLIPNATVTPITWLIGGALLGYAEVIARTAGRVGAPAVAARPRTIL